MNHFTTDFVQTTRVQNVSVIDYGIINTTDTMSPSPVDNDVNNGTSFEYPEPYATVFLVMAWLIIPLVIISLLGNTLVIIVMSKAKNRRSSTSVYFTALAVSDICLALSVALERWIYRVYNVGLYNVDVRVATIKVVMTYSNIQLSAWILVSITIERMISIAIPYLVKDICTRRLAQAVVVATVFILVVFNTAQFTLIVSVYLDEYENLQMSPKVANGGMIITWLDFTFSFFLPIAIIGFGSIFILINLSRVTVKKHDKKSNRNRSVTRALLAANLVFVLTMSPYLILKLLFPVIYGTTVSINLFWTLTEVFLFFSDLNCALNFFVYVLSGARFRGDVMELFYQRKTGATGAIAIHTLQTTARSSHHPEINSVTDSSVVQPAVSHIMIEHRHYD